MADGKTFARLDQRIRSRDDRMALIRRFEILTAPKPESGYVLYQNSDRILTESGLDLIRTEY